ncbi:MAG: hypothetical protein WC505_04060 [Patescibacteria group bacterium]
MRTERTLPERKKKPPAKKRAAVPQHEITIGHWPFFTLMVLPLFFVMLFVSTPGFSLSAGTVNAIIVSAMYLFFGAVVFLVFAIGKYMYDSLKPYPKEIDRDERRLELTLFFIFCLVVFPTLIITLL